MADPVGPAGASAEASLHLAAANGNLEKVEGLLTTTNVNSRDEKEKTPLHYAAENGKLDVVKLLLDREAQVDGRMEGGWAGLFARMKTKMQKTPLHYAAREDHFKVVECLVDKGAQVNSKDEDDKTPLHYAAAGGHYDIVDILVTNKAQVDSKDKEEKTPLHYAAMGGHQFVIAHLLEKVTPSSREGYVNSKDKDEKTPLHYAALNGHHSVVEYLIKQEAVVDSKDKSQMTPLHCAAEFGHHNVVEKLVKKKADIDSKDDHDLTPVYKATRNGHYGVSKYLLGMDANKEGVNQAMIDDLEETIRLSSSDPFDDFKAKIECFEEQKFEITDLFKDHNTPLLHCAVAAGSKEVVEELVKLGAKTDHHEEHFEWKNVKYEQIAPLHLAAESGNDVIVRFLLKEGASADTEDKKKNTPLHAAASKGHQTIVVLLIEHGADVHSNSQYKRRTPLHFASYNGHTETVDFLLKREADPTAVDFNGRNCLHLAIRANHKETVLRLLQDERWKKMLKKYDKFLEIPLKLLIDQMPDVAEMCLSKCVETNEGELTSFMEKVRPTSDAYHVSFDYEFLDPDSLLYHGISFKTVHPLHHVSESGNTKLLFHPLVTSLLKHKWDSFGHKLFFANLSIYIMFLFSLTGFGLVALNPLEKTREHESISETQPGDCMGGSFEYGILAASTILLAIVRLIMEMAQLSIHGLRAYLRDLVNYIEITLYVSSIIFASVFTTPCLHVHHWQWQFGVLAVFLGWIVLITFLQKWPPTGIYVIAFLKIMESFLKVAFLAVLLVIAFALPFYMQFFEPGKMRHAFMHPARAVVKVMSMTTGELDYDDIFHQQEGEEEVGFPLISFPLWVIFLVMMPVLLNNYLTGLAIGEVKERLEQCKVNKAKLQIDLVLSLEGMLKNEIFLSLLNKVHLYLERKMNQLLLYLEGRLKTKFPLHLKGMLENKLLYFIPHVPMQTGPIKPKSFLDEYHTTGQEIAQAIKQQAPTQPTLEEPSAKHSEQLLQLQEQVRQLADDIAIIKEFLMKMKPAPK